jgi:hypothetical protein
MSEKSLIICIKVIFDINRSQLEKSYSPWVFQNRRKVAQFRVLGQLINNYLRSDFDGLTLV